MHAVVLATRNRGKIAELSKLLEGFHLEVRGLDAFPEVGEVPETGDTFAANALQKASTVAGLTGLVAVADDSGLVVDALGGAPGVYSARYAGEKAGDAANNAKLLAALENVPDERRRAAFVCVMVCCLPDGRILTSQGRLEGLIRRTPQGHNGFGYDPLFELPGRGLTTAQLSTEDKNAISHRGQALRTMVSQIAGFLATWSAPDPA